MRPGRCFCYLFVGLLTLGGVNAAHAWSFSVEGFIIDDDGSPADNIAGTDPSLLFQDYFESGGFYSNPDSSITYTSVKGSPVEGPSLTGGSAVFDAYDGELGISGLTGNLRYLNRARVNTQLFDNTGFFVAAGFALTTPDPRGRYGIRLNDAGSSASGDSVEVAFRHTGGGDLKLSFRYADSALQQWVNIDEVPYVEPTGADLLALLLFKANAASDAITAAYAFLDWDSALQQVSIIGSLTDFTGSHNIFNGENYTVAEMFGVQVVPETEVWAMMVAGMGLIGYWARRRAR